MAILHTLRTNRLLKTITFIVIGVGMFLFVDPQFDSLKTIKSIFKGEKSMVDPTSLGTAYGKQLFNTYQRFSS